MATHFFSRSIPKSQAMASFLSRSLSTATSATSLSTAAQSRSSSLSLLHRLRPLAGVMASAGRLSPAIARCLSTRSTTSSLRDPNPNWSNRPPKETILLDGCDFEHCEEEARMKIYSVSTRCYYAFGALVSEEVSLKIKELPGVRWVLPDSYLDVKNKDYGGEPFINGQAVPYDPKYHEEWIRNNSRANERNRRNDRPRNFDRSRNFERRRENMQNRDFQNTGPSPMPNQAGPDSGPGPANMGPPPPNSGPMSPNMGPPPPNRAPMQPPNMGPPPPNRAPMPPPNMGPANNYNKPQPSNNWNSGPPNSYNQAPPNSYNQMPPNNYNQMPPNNPGGVPPNNMAPPSNAGWNDPGQYQNNYTPDRDAGVNPGPNRY
ncbi:unnamed protein product [Malus baccata var. baccata]